MNDVSFTKYLDGSEYTCLDYEDDDMELYTCDTGEELIVIMIKNGVKVYSGKLKKIECKNDE